MSKIRKPHLLGVGVLTPVLAGYPLAAGARSADLTPAVQNQPTIVAPTSQETAKRLLELVAVALSPAEKLRIAGDRIRLSQVDTRAPRVQSKMKQRVAPYTGGCSRVKSTDTAVAASAACTTIDKRKKPN